MLIVDAHQDLAWNMLALGRDYTRSVTQTRQAENGSLAPLHNGDTLLGWPEYQIGHVAFIGATLFAAPQRYSLGEWDTLCYSDYDMAHRLYSDQLDAYYRLVDAHPEKFRIVLSHKDLQNVVERWAAVENPGGSEGKSGATVGLLILMEGAEGVREPAELDAWWRRGVRIIGPAWSGTRYCGGAREPGPLTSDGRGLLEAMAGYGLGLDLSHMDELAVLQALDMYPGILLASHSNALRMIKGSDSNRHLSDRAIQGILERNGVIGIVLWNPFLMHNWKHGDPRQMVSLQHVAAQIDYICQMAGDASHVGIGTDFDGGFGLQSAPDGVESIADLQKLAPILRELGYSSQDIEGIFGKNWLRIWESILPEDI